MAGGGGGADGEGGGVTVVQIVGVVGGCGADGLGGLTRRSSSVVKSLCHCRVVLGLWILEIGALLAARGHG